MRRRWWLILLVLIFYTALVAEIGWLCCAMVLGQSEWIFDKAKWSEVFMPFTDPAGATAIALPAAILTVTQVLFLIPAIRPELMRKHKHSLWISVIGSGFAGAMLAAGLFLALTEGYGLLRNIDNPVDKLYSPLATESFIWWPMVLVAWVLWIPLLMVFARRQPTNRLPDRLIGVLFAGTLVELLVVTPIDIMVRRRTSCWCGTGTAMGYCLAVCATLWIAGPGIIVVLTSKRRRWWVQQRCSRCGYAKGPSPGERCPECGFDWGAQGK